MQLTSKFLKQKMMRSVLIALIPCFLMSVYLFGWRVLVLAAAITLAGLIAEYAIMYLIQKEKTKISEACFVSCLLFTLTLPPATPIWVGVVGIVVGIVFGKCAFGGFGQNIFNPAMLARCFVYVSFPVHLTVTWTNPFSGFPGGFARFTGTADLLTTATPMITMRDSGTLPSISSLLLGTTGGSLGETSVLLILIGAAYLIYTKTASWKIMAGCLGSALVLSSIFYLTGVEAIAPHYLLLSGGFLFATVFMATDPITAARTEQGKWIFGIFIGLVAVIIRRFSLFTEGIMFAVLIGNTFAPLIDRQVKAFLAKKKLKKEVAA